MSLATSAAPKSTSTPDSKKSRSVKPVHKPMQQVPQQEQTGCACGGGCPKCSGPKVEQSTTLEREAREASSDYRAMRRAAGAISPEGKEKRRPSSARLIVRSARAPDRALGEGKALERKSREDFEAFFDADFCAVRLHTGPPAERFAARYGTQALAFGNHIILSSRAPPINSEVGREVLVHELTHCLQQAGESGMGEHPARGPPSLAISRLSEPVVQGFDVELPTLSDVGNAVANVGEAAWDTAADVGESVVEFAAENLEAAVDYLAPGLMDFINGGLGTQLTSLFCSGIDALIGTLLSPLEELDLVSAIESTFSELGEGVRGMWSGLSSGASDALGFVLRPLVDALQIFDDPIIAGITSAVDTANGIFTGLWDNIGVPVLDFLESVGGVIWEGFNNIFDWLERITRPIRETASDIWQELTRRFNLAWNNTSDMRQSIADEATDVWEGFLETIEPIRGPVTAVAGVLLILSPFGPMIILTQVIPPLWDKLMWLWNNWNTDEILVQAKDILANDILPTILGVISGVSSALASAVSWLTSITMQVATAFSGVLTAFGLNSCLTAVTRILNHVSGQFQDLADWAEGGFQGLGDAIRAVFDALVAIFQPILDFLVRLLIVAANPPLLPIAITAAIWLLCPDDLKPPVINFVLDILIQVLRAMPTFMPGLFPLATLMKSGALGFMASLRIQTDDMKIAASNKIAGLMAGGGIQFVAGFAFGLLRGIIDGILDPFRIIWMLIRLTVAVCRAIGTMISRLSSTAAGIGARTRSGLGLQPQTAQPSIGGAFLTDLGFGGSATPAAPAGAAPGAAAPAATAAPAGGSTQARAPPTAEAQSNQTPEVVSHRGNAQFDRLVGIRRPSGPTEAARETAVAAGEQSTSSTPPGAGGAVVSSGTVTEEISTTTTFSTIESPGAPGEGSEPVPVTGALGMEGEGDPLAGLMAEGPLPSDEDVIASISAGSGTELLGAASGLEGGDQEGEEGLASSVQEAGASPRSLAQFLGDAWDAALNGAAGLGASMSEALLRFILLPDFQLGNKLGFVTGFVLFQLILAYLTAGVSAAGSAASPILRAVVGFLDLGGQILGLVGRGLARLAVPIGKLLAAGGRFLGRIPGVSSIFGRFAGALQSLMRVGGQAASATVGAARRVTDPLGEAAMRGVGLPTSAIDDVMGRGGRALAGEGTERVAREGTEAAGSRAGREGSEAASSKAGSEGSETAGSRAGREAEESGAGRTGREAEEQAAARQGDDATKAAERPAAEALGRSICEANDLINPSPHPALVVAQLTGALSRYRWIDSFGYRRTGGGTYQIYYRASPPQNLDSNYTSSEGSESAPASGSNTVETPAVSPTQAPSPPRPPRARAPLPIPGQNPRVLLRDGTVVEVPPSFIREQFGRDLRFRNPQAIGEQVTVNGQRGVIIGSGEVRFTPGGSPRSAAASTPDVPSSAPRDMPTLHVDRTTRPDTVPPGVVLEFPGGHKTWRTRGGSLAHESHVGPSVGRRAGYEHQFPRGSEVGLRDTERAHTLGQGTGFESPYAIPHAPRFVNQQLQNNGIEELLRGLRADLPEGVTILLRTETRYVPGTRRLDDIIYRVDLSDGASHSRMFEFRIGVDYSGPRPRSFYDSPEIINPNSPALADMVDVPRRVAERLARIRQIIANRRAAAAAARKAKGPAPSAVPHSLNETLQERGDVLNPGMRKAAVSHFGQSFDHVRIHRGVTASRAAQESNAEALSVGGHIILDQSSENPRTLAHELSHVANENVTGSGSGGFLNENSAEEQKAQEAEHTLGAQLEGRSNGEGDEQPSPGNQAAPSPAAPPASGAAQQAPPSTISGITPNISTSAMNLAHVPACGNQPTIRFTAAPAGAVPITWSVAAGTAAVATGTSIAPATVPGTTTVNTLMADLTLGATQTGGTLRITAQNAAGSRWMDFTLASHPTGITSTRVIGNPTSANSYGGVFDHVFTSNDGQVTSLQNVAVGERFPNLPNPTAASHTFATPFGQFTLHTGTLPNTASGASGNWFLTSAGELGGTHDNVTIAKSMIDIGRHISSDSNPTPTHPVPAQSVITQDFHWWCPHSAANARWTQYATTTHTRRLELNNTGGADFKAIVNGQTNTMAYDGKTGIQNATATPATTTVSPSGGTANTVQIDATKIPSTRNAHFSIRGNARGCTINASTGVLTIGTQTGTVKVRVADSRGGTNWDEVDVTINAAPAPTPTPPSTPPSGTGPVPAPTTPAESVSPAVGVSGRGGGEDEPHYPTVSEQAEIERLLGRDNEPTTQPDPTSQNESQPTEEAESPSDSQPDVVERGRSLNETEQAEMADEIEPALLASVRERAAENGEGGPERTTLSEEDAIGEAERARDAIYERFGDYLSGRTVITTDSSRSVDERRAAEELLFQFSDMSDAARAMLHTFAETTCETCSDLLEDLNDDSKDDVMSIVVRRIMNAHGDEMRSAASVNIAGSYSPRSHRMKMPLSYQYQAAYHATLVHEMMHSLTHPAFQAAFGNERDIIEGFTEYFTRQVASTTYATITTGQSTTTVTRASYQNEFNLIQQVRAAMGSSAPGAMWSGTSPEESLRRAYFEGDLELIGWRPSGPSERDDVEAAGGSEMWDAEEANAQEEARRILFQQQQDSHPNILGVGLFFSNTGTGSQISVNYARVLLESEPYSRHRLIGEIRLTGGPIIGEDTPAVIGGSLGLGYEYQEPWLYVGGGVRFEGSVAPEDGTGRLDLSPFAGIGVRAWQRVRIGAEAFVLIPVLPNQEVAGGGGATVAVEF